MVYPSGEVETVGGDGLVVEAVGEGSGWFIRPGKLKPNPEEFLGQNFEGSGWFIRPGKLKRGAAGWHARTDRVPDRLSVRGS